jgi:hypothetical protein
MMAARTTDLIGTLAQRHGFDRDDAERIRRAVTIRAVRSLEVVEAPRLASDAVTAERDRLLHLASRRAFTSWTSEISVLLLVQALDHAHDCLNPDCEQCDAIAERLEEHDLWETVEAARELGRLLEVERAAGDLIAALDSRGPARGAESARAAVTLRASLVRIVHDLPMSDRKLSPADKQMIA